MPHLFEITVQVDGAVDFVCKIEYNYTKCVSIAIVRWGIEV